VVRPRRGPAAREEGTGKSPGGTLPPGLDEQRGSGYFPGFGLEATLLPLAAVFIAAVAWSVVHMALARKRKFVIAAL
jgi:hypothetical protein